MIIGVISGVGCDYFWESTVELAHSELPAS
jgi:hypothetical protein